MSNIFSFVGKPAKKILCAMLSIILLIACIPVYANAASNGGFSLSIKWNGSGQDANLYTYDSTTPESRLVRLLVSYKNTRVSNGYDPGDIVITLPGISGAAREGTIRPDAIAADRAGSSSHNYDWSYTYASDTDTYTFTNNSAIDQNTAFEGSFEIIWNLDSRETIHNYAQTFQATMYTTHGEQLKSNTIRYTQTRSKDQYTVSETAAALYSAEGLTGVLPAGTKPDDYTWVKYDVYAYVSEQARGVPSTRFDCWFLEDSIVQSKDLVKTGTVKTIDGKRYEGYTRTTDDTTVSTRHVRDTYVAYPDSQYEGQTVYTYVELKGTYYEETSESLLAQTSLLINLTDYGFLDIPGDIYDVSKYSYGEQDRLNEDSYPNSHCDNCKSGTFGGKGYGYIDSADLPVGSFEYRSRLPFIVHYDADQADYYDLELVDDILDIELKNGSTRQMADDEYHFTKVSIPSARSITNINDLPIEQDKYTVDIYVRRQGQTNLSLIEQTTPYQTITITDTTQTVTLPDNTVGVRIVFRNIQESFDAANINVYYKLHTDDQQIRTDSGRVINNMFVKLYRGYNGKYEWLNTEFDRNPDTYENIDQYNRDLELYGHTFDRENATLHVLEIPSRFSVSNTFYRGSETPEAYTFYGRINAAFNGNGTSPEKFSLYTILPGDIRLAETCKDPEKLLQTVYIMGDKEWWEDGYDTEIQTIITHTQVEIIDNYKNSGRQYLAFHFDFSDGSDHPWGLYIGSIPLYVDKDLLTDPTYQYTWRVAAVVDDKSGNWQASYQDNQSFENNLWHDIDRDNNITEAIALSYDELELINPENTMMQVTQAVKTENTDSYVQPELDDEEQYIDDQLPTAYTQQEYSYKLRLRTGENVATNIVFYDALETDDNAAWQGEFVRVDSTRAERLLGRSPTVYYSSSVQSFTTQPNLSSGNWTTVKPSTVRSIAVDFGNASLAAGKSVYVEIVMRAPEITQQIRNKITENSFYIHYDKTEKNSGQIVEHSSLPSNSVAVKLISLSGTIVLNKIDATSGARVPDTKFDLYEMSGSSPDLSADTRIASGLTTDSKGSLQVTVPYSTYYFVETEAAIGYQLSTSPILVTLSGNEPNKVVTVTASNPRKDGIFSIRKVSDRDNTRYLSGAVFSLYTSEGTLIRSNLVTGSDGILTLQGLAWNNYYLLETTPPDGFKLSTEKIEFSISAENDAGRLLPTVTVENEQLPASAILTKYEKLENGQATTTGIDGAVFELWQATGSGNKRLGSYVTQSGGRIVLDDLTLGKYFLRETVVPNGYKATGSDISFTVTAQHTITPLQLTTYNTRMTGAVWLQKLDDQGRYVEGARFGLFRESDDVQVNAKGSPSSVTFTTDSEGVIEVSVLYWNNFYFKELEAPTGYQISDTKYSFSINQDTVAQRVLIHAVNAQIPGSVKLTKVSEANENLKLSRAVFTLYRSDGSVYKDDLRTGSDGTLTVEGIPWGSYYFLEKTAPTGYGLNPEKFRFSVNYLTAGHTQEITVTDPQVTCDLTITKRIRVKDVVLAHGDVSFIFKVEGTDTSGESHTYYQMVTYDETFVNDYIDRRPYYTNMDQSIVFRDIPMGTYEVTEMETFRYSMQSNGITIVSGTGSTTTNSANVTLNASSRKAEVRFSNTKVLQSSTTHTGQAVNTVKREHKLTAILATWNGPDAITSETLDRSKLQVVAVYDDGRQTTLSNTAYSLNPASFDASMNGNYTVTVSYTESGITRTDTFDLYLNLPLPFTWELTSSNAFTDADGTKYDGTVTINGYTGASSVVNFPGKVSGLWNTNGSFNDNGKTYKVTRIANDGNALDGMSGASQIILPEGIESIGAYAFSTYKLSGDLIIPDSVTVIEEYAFYNCYDSSGSLTLGENLITIGSYAFWACYFPNGGLVIPDKVTTISDHAFQYCAGFPEGLVLGSSVQIIGDYAFSADFGFTGTLTIPDSVTSIGGGAFESCSGFSGTIRIPYSVNFIDALAFSGTGGSLLQLPRKFMPNTYGFTGTVTYY